MRNFVIAFLVLFLPLQWGITVLAAYCVHEESPSAVQHIGHHGHHREHQGTTLKADAGKQGKALDLSCNADHEHGHGTHAIFRDSHLPGILASAADDSPYGAFVPDPPLDNLLRPPLVTLA